MRFYNADFHLIFDGGEISEFRVPRVYIWLNCAFLLWILGVRSYLKMILMTMAPFSQSMSPWRGMAAQFRSRMIFP